MKNDDLARERENLHEAFIAGWQAALGVTITSPPVLAVVESCFERWLEEAIDEADVLGFLFRRRNDLPTPVRRPADDREDDQDLAV